MYHVFHTWIDPIDPWNIWVDPSHEVGAESLGARDERRVLLDDFCAERRMEFVGWNPALNLLGVFRDAN